MVYFHFMNFQPEIQAFQNKLGPCVRQYIFETHANWIGIEITRNGNPIQKLGSSLLAVWFCLRVCSPVDTPGARHGGLPPQKCLLLTASSGKWFPSSFVLPMDSLCQGALPEAVVWHTGKQEMEWAVLVAALVCQRRDGAGAASAGGISITGPSCQEQAGGSSPSYSGKILLLSVTCNKKVIIISVQHQKDQFRLENRSVLLTLYAFANLRRMANVIFDVSACQVAFSYPWPGVNLWY